MIEYLEPQQAHAVIDHLGLQIRDEGLLHSALARPAAGMFGENAYPSLELKAAALLSSIAQNHTLVDGDKRLSLYLTFAFLHINGLRTTFTNGEAFDLIMRVAQRDIELDDLAADIAAHTAPA